MPISLYVGNLSYDTRDEDLEKIFKPFGNFSSCKVVMDNFSGRSKGFGFVEMEEADEGQAAIKALDETEFMDRRIRVNEARSRAERGDRPSRGRGGYDRRGGGGGGDRDRGYDRDRGSDRGYDRDRGERGGERGERGGERYERNERSYERRDRSPRH